MNEEERKAIEKFIKKCNKFDESVEIKGVSVGEEYRTLETVCKALDLVEKLQKENEELKIKNNAIKRESEAYAENMIRLDNELKLEKEKSKYEWIRQNCLPQELVNKLYIPIQKIKDKIEEYKNMLKTCNKVKDIDRIKAINERILELEELLGGRKENESN